MGHTHMAYLTKDLILAAQDVQTEEVEAPEWGGTVLIRGLTGTERDAYEASLRAMRGKEIIPDLSNMRSKLVARAIINEDGTRMFTDRDIVALGAKSSVALTRIFTAVAKLSGMNEEAAEEAAENLEYEPSDEPTST